MFTENLCNLLRSRLGRTLLACPLALSLVVPQQMPAWGSAGHEAVAWVAWQQMTPAARAKAIALIKVIPTLTEPNPKAGTTARTIPGGADWIAALPAGISQDQKDVFLFMQAATWPDSIKHKWLHDSDTPPAGVTTDVHIGFNDTASHGYWHFVDTGFASDASKVPATPVPNAATQITALSKTLASKEDAQLKAYDLVWLEHLVGDVHQPMHGVTRFSGNKGDAGGNSVKITLTAAMKKVFEGGVSKSAPTELHAFWDSLPGEGSPAAALPEAEAFAKALPKVAGPKLAVVDPAKWASDSFDIAKADAYAAPIGPGLTAADGTGFLITQAYFDKAMKDAKSEVALAGARLAKILNDSLK